MFFNLKVNLSRNDLYPQQENKCLLNTDLERSTAIIKLLKKFNFFYHLLFNCR